MIFVEKHCLKRERREKRERKRENKIKNNIALDKQGVSAIVRKIINYNNRLYIIVCESKACI